MKKLGFGIILLFGYFQLATAQSQYRQEFSASLGGGISALYPKMNMGDYKPGFNGSASLDYTYFFNKNFGISSGLLASQYITKMNVSSVSGGYSANDGEDDFIYNYTVQGLEEKQQVIYLRVPVMFQFQTSGYNRFYFRAGGSIGLPVYQRYTSRQDALSTSAYYPQWDVTLYVPEFRGLGLFENNSYKGDLDLDFSYMASVETGIKWTVDEDFYIYTGIYADYGINNVLKKNAVNQDLVGYNAKTPYPMAINSLLQSGVSRSGEFVNYVDQINPLSLGIKVRISFGFGDFIGKRIKPASQTKEYFWK